MSMRDLIAEAMRALHANRGRSLLTILGIVIGITAVISMTSLIGGVRNYMMSSLGLNAARVLDIGGPSRLSSRDIKRLGQLVPDYEYIEGEVMSWTQMRVDQQDVSVTIMGANSRYHTMRSDVNLVEGRLFESSEETAGERSVVIDQAGVKILFGSPDTDAVGRTLTLNGHDYTIVGISQTVYMGAQESSFQAYLPLETAQRDFNGGDAHIDQAQGMVREGADTDAVSEQTKTQLAKILNLSEDDDSIFINSMKAQIEQMGVFMGAFQLIMGTVAGISLLVGGIGIMNMMLTNVTERIREIGVRRALGARRHDITMQFLVESAVLCVTGGIIGTVLGYLIAFAITAVANAVGTSMMSSGMALSIAPEFSLGTIALAVGLSVGIGIIFGYYPARRAAKLDPVESLRYQ